MIKNKQLLTETNIINGGLASTQIICYFMHILDKRTGFSVHLRTPRYELGVITLIKAYFDFSSASEKVMHI